MSVLDHQRRLLLELLDLLRPHWRRDRNLPARLTPWLAAHRAGSRDRRLYREFTYTALRILPWIENASPADAIGLIAAESADTPSTHAFRAAFALPDLVATANRSPLLPAWFDAASPTLAADPAQRTALLSRAPLWLRLQTDTPAPVAAEFATLGWSPEPAPILPIAWRLPADTPVTSTAAHRNGLVEIQDLGSQLILAAADLAPGGHWLDACAGAGGKTLQLARLLGPAGRVTAHDIRPAALSELAARAQRAGLPNITITPAGSPPSAQTLYDGVLIDAPCSGSGTWRRAPHLKWTTTPADLTAASATQHHVLTQFAPHVRPAGGRLIYATCSLARTENEDVIAHFLTHHPDFTVERPNPLWSLLPAGDGTLIPPATHDTDAFFFAVLRRT